MNTIREIVKSRLASPGINIEKGDMLSELIKDMEKDNFVTPEFIIQFLFTISFVAFESIPPMLAFALNFISQDQAVLRELIVSKNQFFFFLYIVFKK